MPLGKVFCNARVCVSYPGYVGTLQAHEFFVNQGGTADNANYSSLAEQYFCQGLFYSSGGEF